MEQKVGVLIGKDEIAQTLSRQPETFQFIFPVIISCINYRFPFGAGEGHQTGIIMKLDRIDPNPPQPGTSVGIDTKLGPIPAGDLRLTISPVGSYAD
jgi:hypothetical protein